MSKIKNNKMKYIGFLLMLISSICFGLLPIFATFAYENHVSTQVILLFRFLLAAIFLNIYVLTKKHKYPRGKALVILIVMGGVGYAAQSFFYFSALPLIGSSLTSILLYLHPGIVLVLSIFLLKNKIKKVEIVALLLATIGAILVIGIKFHNVNYIGIVFGVSAAFVYSIYILAGAEVMKGMDPIVGSTVIISSAAMVYTFYGISSHVTIPSDLNQWIWILAIVIISTIIAISTFFAGLKIVGPVKATMISTFEPVVTVFFSYLVLKETINIYQVGGAIFIITAAIIIAKESKHE